MQAGQPLSVTYFDGTRAQARTVQVRVADGDLTVSGDGVARSWPLRDVQWPERARHGLRITHFKGGGTLQCADLAAWDAWAQANGRRDPLAVRLQQNWRWVVACLAALVGLLVSLQQWGLPWAARTLVARAPRSVDVKLGEAALPVIDAYLMRPSKLPRQEQDRLRNALLRHTATLPAGMLPKWQLVFRQSRIGPNAFALPDGTLVLTDELVALVDRDEQVLMGVLAHELGHVAHRDSLRLLVQTTALGTLTGVLFGDFNALLAAAPTMLGTASYTREAEHNADVMAADILKRVGISPTVMVTLFDKLAEERERTSRKKAATGKDGEAAPAETQPSDSPDVDKANNDKAGKSSDKSAPEWLGIALASHPADADRVQFFRDAAAKR